MDGCFWNCLNPLTNSIKISPKHVHWDFPGTFSLLTYIFEQNFIQWLLITQNKDINSITADNTEAVTRRCSMKRVFLKSSEFTGKYLCRSIFFYKVADIRLATSIKKGLPHKYFPVIFLFSKNTGGCF